MSHAKLKIWQKKSKIWPKSSKISKINIGFCDNSIEKSLVFILKYTVCKFCGCTTVFQGNEDILNLEKKNEKASKEEMAILNLQKIL